MGIFDSDWQRLHKKISHRYEQLAMRNADDGLSPDIADTFGIITEIVRENTPNLSQAEAMEFVKIEYNSFKEFDVCDIIRDALRQRNPEFQETDVLKFLDIARRRFHGPELEHGFFLFFVISKIIELKKLSISRGSYLIEIVRGRIPRPSPLIRFFQLWRIFAHDESRRLQKGRNRPPK